MTELSDGEFYECLRWANNKLMKNYYNKQRASTLAQIDHLYTEKDVTFRGFRHHQPDGMIGMNFGIAGIDIIRVSVPYCLFSLVLSQP